MTSAAPGLARLLAQATPGPWEAGDTDEHGWIVDATSVGMTVAETTRKDAALIALAPDAVSLLVDMASELSRLKEEAATSYYGGQPDPDITRSLLARFADLDRRAAQ